MAARVVEHVHVGRAERPLLTDPRRAVTETLATAGQAMLFTTLVLSTGFAIYTVSSMDVLANFGLITAGAISLAFVADVLLAPALMTSLVEWESR